MCTDDGTHFDKHADELLQGQAMNCTEENATLTWFLMAVHADMEMKKNKKSEA